MHSKLRFILARRPPAPPWNDRAPVREELFGVERLEQHAESLATAQPVTRKPPRVFSLRGRLDDNAAVLLLAYRASAVELESGRSIVPAAQWLLENYHLVDEQIREIRDDLPAGYYRQLPKLAAGPFAGYPRVFGLAWAFVAHTDSHFDPAVLRRFVVAYQRVQPLTIGELWAIAITLRIVLIENLRRLADQITAGRGVRADADALANRLLASGGARSALESDISTRSTGPLSELFAAQLAKRLRDQDPTTTPALGWLRERLGLQDADIEELVMRAQQRQGASNVSVRNVIGSMRLISDIDWAELFESVSLVDERLRTASDFAAMDFPTRNLYRSAIEQLARGSSFTELEIADHALSASYRASTETADTAMAELLGDPGYFLIAEGRPALERMIAFRPSARLQFSRFNIRLGIGGYVGTILCVATLLLAFAVWQLSGYHIDVRCLALFAAIGFLPTTAIAAELVNRAVTWSFGATSLPGLSLVTGVPSSLRTLVAVPTLLTTEAAIRQQIEQLEVHHLAGAGGDLSFVLLLDGVDADSEVLESDTPLLAVAARAIDTLNRRYGPGIGGPRFLLLHRRRCFSAGEGKWMGWERKRGKLHELNRLLRGAPDTSFIPIAGRLPQVPADVRYVITLDADTRLPRDAALKLIGKMAHPLNRPKFSAASQRVIGGYAILQPRVTPSLPIGREGSLFQRVFSGPGGIDPYAAAVSDVYQDLFGEGSYTGKGIYDVDAFEAALDGRVPENAMLSHDLFEGTFARAGLATDIEVVEEFPARYDIVAKRQHRWTRGDWQLLPFIFGDRGSALATPIVGSFKMLDNLRRSLLAPTTLLALGLSWLLPQPSDLSGVLAVLATIAIPAFLPSFFSVMPRRADCGLGHHLRVLASDLRLAAMQTLLTIAFLPDQAWRMADAIIRTIARLLGTRRHLLEWTTFAESTGQKSLNIAEFYRAMANGGLLGLAMAAVAIMIAASSWHLVLPFAVLWLAAPALAMWVSRSPKVAGRIAVSDRDRSDLRRVARSTWRFFETFVTALDNMLPPDNFQEDPKAVIAHRTSPTNIGLYLLSAVAARDFGWAGTTETVERLEATFESMQKLRRFRGHFLNWYGTRDHRALEPAYVSSVDSGNLAGHLIAVANACEQWREGGLAREIRLGLNDNLNFARAAVGVLPAARLERGRQLVAILDEIETQLNGAQAMETLFPVLKRLTEKAAKTALSIVPMVGDDSAADLLFWIEALQKLAAEHGRDRCPIVDTAPALDLRIKALADRARGMAMAMDFGFLLHPARKLLSIGYSLTSHSLDPGCYDLLASEARLASLFAIAKGDLPTRHWFRLGRLATPVGNGSALISWSGSMFEYLMPSLVMRAPVGSLLEQTNRLVVAKQQSQGRILGVPWGVSESAYNARDLEFTYQYSNFGITGLGLKRGLSNDIVIAPYATGLAAMVDPHRAAENYRRLAQMGAMGRYGFFEALDFTRSRLPESEGAAIIRSFMAHHQGMTIVAIANTLQDGQIRAYFHREPTIRASELLLQERMPREVAVFQDRAEEMVRFGNAVGAETVSVRRVKAVATEGPPITHLLSNGRYCVMLTASGAGYSRLRDNAVTRWHEDPTKDDWGAFVFLRDIQSGSVWSAGAQPVGNALEDDEVIFSEDYAQFIRRDDTFATTMDVLVSGEDDGEVRRVSLANTGRRPRLIDITSYSELVLTTPGADNAHPAFAKMFVRTEYLPEFGALIATRRLRLQEDAPIWAAHFAVVEGDIVADPQYESDRSRFVGRGRTVGAAGATIDRPLSNTVGTVLDPIFSLRYRVAIAPGKVARVAFWTLVASSRAELLDLIDKHHDRHAFDRAKTLAWTQAQVQLRHLGISAEEAADFQRLAAPIIYAHHRFREKSDVIIRGAGAQSGLWPFAISGDLPIVVLRIDDIDDIGQVRQLLLAHEYWRMKRLAVDLVIVNERSSSYTQDLQSAIETAVRSSQSRSHLDDQLAQGSVYALRADLMSAQAHGLLQSVARVVLLARRGSIAQQLARLVPAPDRSQSVHRAKPLPQASMPFPNKLEFFNGIGGFDQDGREYVIVLNGEQATPAPWINVIANPGFGFQVSAEGSGYTWAENSRENQLTPWTNDPVVDPPGEAIYIRDTASGDLWTATAQPIRDGGTYIARHGRGYCRFEHRAYGIALDLLQYVPLADPIKISRLRLTNLTAAPRRLSITTYVEWTLGTSRGANGPFITTQMDAATGAMLARNKWNIVFSERVAFADLGGRQTAHTGDRTEFLGRTGDCCAPLALSGTAPLSGRTGAGLDPCTALQCTLELAAFETVEVVSFIGQCASAEEARSLILRYRESDLDDVLRQVTDFWDGVLGAVQVKTPDRALDIMVNGWLLYQTLACRIFARSAFYQASGAYGFRDQLQDGMALSFAKSDETRRHLLRAAARQFVEGDVQHWWLPQSGQGVRSRISDDRVWLAFAAATYIASSNDAAVLDENIAFLEAPALQEGEHERFFRPTAAAETASLFEHCARGLDQCLERTGRFGLPLIGTGDWNDGMNRVGAGGKGESVWLGWLLVRTIALFAPFAESRDARRAERWRAHAASVLVALEQEAWDGAWYRRATFDDGTWLGSKHSEECRIDAIAQSWAVLSGAADPTRAGVAMASLDNYLIRRDDALALLFAPPFDKTSLDPGYIGGYPPGLRENGGQYSHAAMWTVLAFTQLGEGDKAFDLFAMLNPINHAHTAAAAARYKVEPYVVAADVYSIAPHVGRGGWTWYTGAAGWMYRAGVEGILGIRRDGGGLHIDPCIPATWPGFEATVKVASTHYDVCVDHLSGRGRGITMATLDGLPITSVRGGISVAIDGRTHKLRITL